MILERRVSERIPAAYLTHEAWLGDFRFYVDERVIIPRSFIAELLPEALEPWLAASNTVETALDLCTGSGCLAILLAHHFPNVDVDAADISPDALAVAQRNVADHGMQDRVNLVRSDLFSNLNDKTYDLIISNPPYVNALAMAELPAEYRHEPEIALAGGDDGLDAVRIILAKVADFLNPDGLLIVEVGHNRAVTEAAFPDMPFIWLTTASDEGNVFLLRRDDLAACPLTPARRSEPEKIPDAPHDVVGARARRAGARLG